MTEPIPNDVAIYVGIDPTCDKSGVAVWRPSDKQYSMSSFRFVDLFRFFEINRLVIRLVVIGALWRNKPVWYKIVAEICEHLKLHYDLVAPASKLDSKEFARITGIKERTSQEKRNAMMLVWRK
ncbi:MAG: holliday junction resolvase [Podoviridae sp. cty5g4]|nr:MAG: holliday junction resolvase [Podoviridae sp. cty5g4]